MQNYDFSGIWKSKYKYHSDSRNQDFENAHLVRVYQHHNKLVIESLPKVNESYVIMNLNVNDNAATGTWQETTSPEGYYKGATYHGALQMIIEPTGKLMAGTWVGHGKNNRIKTGPWTIEYVGKKLPEPSKA